jgi:hypothetical protein
MVAVAFATPRKLPRAERLVGRVAVLDVAFAGAAGGGFEKVTKKLIDGLGSRLAAWVDHHDHERHVDYASDSRFVLTTKAEHGACPELITPELVQRVGPVDTVVCHTDFDGLASAAKWLRGGREPYPGCDDDARAIDTRLGTPSPEATRIDRALRARATDETLMHAVVRHLEGGLMSETAWALIDAAAAELVPIERETERAARGFRRFSRRRGGGVAYLDITVGFGRLDKTALLLAGQRLEQIAVVVDAHGVALAAPFDSGVDFLALLGLEGGMPTRVSVPRSHLDDVLARLEVDFV